MSDTLMRELVESPHFRWMPGMLAFEGRVIGFDDEDVLAVSLSDTVFSFDSTRMQMIPASTTDPATLGCLLALARERLGKPYWYPQGWQIPHQDTEFELLANLIIHRVEA